MARILVADDHDALREGMTLSLTRLGHEVMAVKGGAEAIASYRKRRADVVVTDLRMVPVDGIEVVRRLREADPEATVVVVSAHGTIAVAVEAMREGAIDFIEKPFPPEVLRARVEKAVQIARERRVDARAWSGATGMGSGLGQGNTIIDHQSYAMTLNALGGYLLIDNVVRSPAWFSTGPIHVRNWDWNDGHSQAHVLAAGNTFTVEQPYSLWQPTLSSSITDLGHTLLQRSDIDIRAIAVVGTGEAHCAAGLRNALDLVALAGHKDIAAAIYCNPIPGIGVAATEKSVPGERGQRRVNEQGLAAVVLSHGKADLMFSARCERNLHRRMFSIALLPCLRCALAQSAGLKADQQRTIALNGNRRVVTETDVLRVRMRLEPVRTPSDSAFGRVVHQGHAVPQIWITDL